MLGRACAACIDRIEVHLKVIGDIPRHHRALEKMHVIKSMGDLCRIMQVLRGAVAVGVGFQIDHMHSGTSRAEMHICSCQMQVISGLAPMQGDTAGGLGQHVLHKGAGKADTPVITKDGADVGEDFDTRRGRL